MTTPATPFEAPSRCGTLVRAELEGEREASSMLAIGVPAPRAPLEALFEACPGEDAVLWEPREGMGIAAAGVAEALEATGIRRMQHVKERALALWPKVRLAALGAGAPKPRCFGGFSFQPGQLRVEPWHRFGD